MTPADRLRQAGCTVVEDKFGLGYWCLPHGIVVRDTDQAAAVLDAMPAIRSALEVAREEGRREHTMDAPCPKCGRLLRVPVILPRGSAFSCGCGARLAFASEITAEVLRRLRR